MDVSAFQKADGKGKGKKGDPKGSSKGKVGGVVCFGRHVG